MIIVPASKSINRIVTNWTCPEMGVLKFNVDGSSLGNPGPAGIGGILGDHLGTKKLAFSKSIGVGD
ncbi:hypothetical protein DITRI_Ditri04bG0017800 [Diplodiscus trichospermus]